MNEREQKLAKEFAEVINRNSAENGSNTPDFILGEYLVRCLRVFETTNQDREKWHGRSDHGSRL